MFYENTIYFIFIVIFTFFVSHDAFARVYKCHDTNGKVVYKNAPCSEGQKSETVINMTGPVKNMIRAMIMRMRTICSR